jgi:alanine-glyoxylate transaminase/serine-glyoxylate transaminase/serine-pyruvate transaminase
MAAPIIGHLDPDFLTIMDETKRLLQFVFQTENELTIPISGTGSAGMEAALCNLIEPADKVIVCVNGFFGERMCEMVHRCGGELIRVEAPWGKAIESSQVSEALDRQRPKVVAIVHAETSTGVLQPLEEIGKLVHEHGAFFLVDAVTSLGGCPVKVDEWKIGVCYSGTQKCLSCPPGLAPITFNAAAMNLVKNRKHKIQSWYLDVSLIERYWGEERFYHHTAPISMNYALREALRLVYEEGLEERFKRHCLNHQALVAGLEAMGLDMLVDEGYRLTTLTTVLVPEGVDEAKVRGRLLNEFNIEIAGGLGGLRGKIWRIGLMGYSSRRENVLLLLSALECILTDEGFKLFPRAGMEEACKVFYASGDV